jgi:hypothetical protein
MRGGLCHAAGAAGRADTAPFARESNKEIVYVRLWGRTMARLSPGVRHGLLGRLTGLPGLRLTPVAFLWKRPPADLG